MHAHYMHMYIRTYTCVYAYMRMQKAYRISLRAKMTWQSIQNPRFPNMSRCRARSGVLGVLHYGHGYLCICMYVQNNMHIEKSLRLSYISETPWKESSLPSTLWQIGNQVWASGCRFGSGRSVCRFASSLRVIRFCERSMA